MRRRIMAWALLLCLLTALLPAAAHADGGAWKQNGRGWWYQNADGSYPAAKWQQIGGKWYYFDSAGYMVTGWLKQGGTWYYLGGSGAMVTGWAKIGGSWYDFSSSGAMLTGWVRSGGRWYYLNGSGAMQTYWQKVGGKWYYLGADGAMRTGAATISGKSYFFSKSGALIGSPSPSDLNTVTYILNISTGKFHKPGCKDVGKMLAVNTVYFSGSRTEAIAFGFSSCGHCHA